ncbi:MAG: CRTAC1 family protein [Flavobacteriales bacterium]|nr:CRTAC1 family protein [Flavobacteriales bacterium]
MYRNVGNGQFEDLSTQTGIASITAEHESFGVVTGDLDNDGYRDLIVTGNIGNPVLLLRNQGDGTFSLIPNALPSDNIWTTSATLGDINKDGYLDIYISAYVYTSEIIRDEFDEIVGFAHDCSANLLFVNNGDFTFTESGAVYGLSDEGCALAVTFTDFDNDRDVDLLLANDFGEWVVPSALYQNQSPSNWFSDVGAAYQMDVQMYGMGIAVGDYDHDNDLDYYQTNIGRNLLSRNDGTVFEDVTSMANVENDSLNGLNTTSWGCFFFDSNNDSWLDLFVANGQLPMAPFLANVPNDPNKLFLNNGDGSFDDISDASGLSVTERSHGTVYADFDKDGRLDIMVSNNGHESGVTRVYYHRNISENSNNWVSFSLEGTQSNRDAIGTRLTAWIDGLPLLSEVDGGSSHASHSSTKIHLGLGNATLIDSVSVDFLSGISQKYYNLPVNQNHNIVEDVATGMPELGSDILVSYSGQSILIQSKMEGKAKIELIDLSGRLIWTLETFLSLGANAFPVPNLLVSMFVLRLQMAEFTFTKQLVLFE